MRSGESFGEVYLCLEVIDMRMGIDRLCAWVAEHAKRAVISGGLYVFVSRDKRRVKALYWDEDGYALWYKRLEAGAVRVERAKGVEVITGVELRELLRGIDYSRLKMRKIAREVYANACV